MRIKSTFWALALIMTAALAGCYPSGAEYVDELDIVYTNHDAAFDFSARTTYSIPDSVIKISGQDVTVPDSNYKPIFLSAQYSDAILAAINQNMASYGWTKVAKGSRPDVILLVSAMTTTNIYYYYDWAYWGWWYPGYYPGWGWYYPGSYYPAYVTGYRSGSVFTQMIDAKLTSVDTDNVPVVWNSIFNGLAEGNASSINARLTTSIGKAFAQSPYLKH
jgi:Domain of unknown function (DUF4136)